MRNSKVRFVSYYANRTNLLLKMIVIKSTSQKRGARKKFKIAPMMCPVVARLTIPKTMLVIGMIARITLTIQLKP